MGEVVEITAGAGEDAKISLFMCVTSIAPAVAAATGMESGCWERREAMVVNVVTDAGAAGVFGEAARVVVVAVVMLVVVK